MGSNDVQQTKEETCHVTFSIYIQIMVFNQIICNVHGEKDTLFKKWRSLSRVFHRDKTRRAFENTREM